MKKISMIFLIALLLLVGGCKKSISKDNPKGLTTSPSPTLATTIAPAITPVLEPSTTPTLAPTTEPTVTLTLEELSVEAYEKFMRNEAKISFDRFMPNDYREEAFYQKGSEYTLSEVLNIITAKYFEYFTDKKVDYIDYSYIDCGKDGVSELALRFNGMNIYGEDDNSTLVYIIKYIDGILSLCFQYETWARSESTLNEYGYYQSGGSGGASNYYTESGLIDKDGSWQFIDSIESELDINQLTWSDKLGQLPIVANTKGITGGIELQTICFDQNENTANIDEVGSIECYYTFYAYDENYEPLEVTNLYTNSIYKEIFDEANVPFVTPDEISAMISEKEEKVGATAEITEGKELTWKLLSGSMFSDYVMK